METKQLLQEELQQVKTIQQNNQAITIEFGQIELAKIDLEDRIENAKVFLKNLKEEEKTLSEFLEQKYGKGSLNIETGQFTPLQ
jgi:hypothetical protein